MKTFILAIILVVASLATMFTAGAACENVTSTKMEYACRACHPQWLDVCRDALQSVPDGAEVTTYALAVTRKASLKYASTMNTINQMLGAGADAGDHLPPGKERKAVANCKEKYGEASGRMASGAAHLSGCDLRHVKQEFMDALTAVSSCLDGLRDSFRSLPLYAMDDADYALTGVAKDLLDAFLVDW